MKHIYITTLLLVMIIIGGCSRSSKTTDSYLTGLSDITVRQYADTTVKVMYHVSLQAGISDPVTLNIEGLPPGVTASPATVTDTVSFFVNITYHIHMTAAASFPVTVSLFSGSGGKRSFSFNIIVRSGPSFSYSISGLHDITVPQYADTTIRLPLTAVCNSGTSEPVYLVADVLPAGVFATPDSLNGTPPFSDSFSFHITANNTGSFPATIHSGSSQGTEVMNFNVNIQPTIDCAPYLPGNYSTNTICTSYSGPGTGIAEGQVYVTAANKLLLHFPLGNLVADINCSTAALNTEPMTSGSYSIPGGTGSFNASAIVVNYSVTGSVNSTCRTTFTR
jgi:hypothetical protein